MHVFTCLITAWRSQSFPSHHQMDAVCTVEQLLLHLVSHPVTRQNKCQVSENHNWRFAPWSLSPGDGGTNGITEETLPHQRQRTPADGEEGARHELRCCVTCWFMSLDGGRAARRNQQHLCLFVLLVMQHLSQPHHCLLRHTSTVNTQPSQCAKQQELNPLQAANGNICGFSSVVINEKHHLSALNNPCLR